MFASPTRAAPAAAKTAAAETGLCDGPHAGHPNGYGAGTAVRRLQLADLVAIEGLAARVVPKGGFGYLAGGAGN